MGQPTRDYLGESTRGFSPKLWKDFPFLEAAQRPDRCKLIFDDFTNCPVFASTVSQRGYYTYQDTGVTMKGLATAGNIGVLEVAGNDADNDEGVLVTGGNATGDFLISDTSGDDLLLVFECRLKKASVGDNGSAFFIGLCEEASGAAEALVNDTGAAADKDRIGFSVIHSAGEEVNAVYKKAGQTQQTNYAAITAMVADTYVKLGFVYNPGDPNGRLIRWFVDGVEKKDYYVTAANIAAATFPDGEELAMQFATKVGTDMAESKLQLDWWACGQVLAN